MAALKASLLDVYSPNLSHLREKLGIGGSLNLYGAMPRQWVYGDSVSQPFLPISMWIFSESHDMQESLS